MTIIIGYIDTINNTIYMGGDSCVSQNTSTYVMKDQKVFQKDEFLIGSGGKLRMSNILKYQFEPPTHPKNMSIEQYMNSLFINKLHKCFCDLDFDKTNEDKNGFDGVILIGYRGHLFEIDCQYGVFEGIKPYYCIGSGGEIALGVLIANEDIQNMSIEDKINQALQITGENDNSVGPPYYILKL